jgi:hypothetical protein
MPRRVFASAGITWPAHLAQSTLVLERGFGFWQIEIAVGVHQGIGFLLPYAHHLPAFSSRVILDRRSFTRFATGEPGFR